MENTAIKTEISSPIFRTIGEVASEIGIPPHVLRFWESKFDIIKPHKRKGGHRYYKPADIQAIRDIKRLLYDEGFTIKGAQKFLKDKDLSDSPDFQANLFEPSFDESPQAANANVEVSDISNTAEANGVLKNIVVQLNIMKRNIEEAR